MIRADVSVNLMTIQLLQHYKWLYINLFIIPLWHVWSDIVNVMNKWIYDHLQCYINWNINKQTMIEQIQSDVVTQILEFIVLSCEWIT
jgi:hypothetical protein